MLIEIRKGCNCNNCGNYICSGDMAYKYRRQRKVLCWSCGSGDKEGLFGQLWKDVKFIVKGLLK